MDESQTRRGRPVWDTMYQDPPAACAHLKHAVGCRDVERGGCSRIDGDVIEGYAFPFPPRRPPCVLDRSPSRAAVGGLPDTVVPAGGFNDARVQRCRSFGARRGRIDDDLRDCTCAELRRPGKGQPSRSRIERTVDAHAEILNGPCPSVDDVRRVRIDGDRSYGLRKEAVGEIAPMSPSIHGFRKPPLASHVDGIPVARMDCNSVDARACPTTGERRVRCSATVTRKTPVIPKRRKNGKSPGWRRRRLGRHESPALQERTWGQRARGGQGGCEGGGRHVSKGPVEIFTTHLDRLGIAIVVRTRGVIGDLRRGRNASRAARVLGVGTARLRDRAITAEQQYSRKNGREYENPFGWSRGCCFHNNVQGVD